MFNTASIKKLQLEKEILIAESEVNRRALQLEFSMIQASILRAKEKVQIGRSIYPALMAVGSLLGFLFLKKKKFGSAPSLLAKVVGGWKIFQRLKPFWSSWRSRVSRREASVD